MFGISRDPSQRVRHHLRESMAAREHAGLVMGMCGDNPLPGSREFREVNNALSAARREHEAALRVAAERRADLEPAVLELADSYRHNPPPFVMYPEKPYRATVVGSLKRAWASLDDEQRSRTNIERHEDTASPFYRGGPEPDDCPFCKEAGDADQAGIVTDDDLRRLLNISAGTEADADIDLDAYRALLATRIAAYSTMGPSAFIEDVETGMFQFTMEDAGVLDVLPRHIVAELTERLMVQYRRAKVMPPEVRELADRLQR